MCCTRCWLEEAPYTGPNHRAIAIKRLTDPVPSVRRVREVVPHTVEQALARALAKVPADRFSSPAEFARALGGVSGPVTPEAVVHQGRRLGRTRVLIAGLGLTVIFGLAAWFARGTATAGDGEYGGRPDRLMLPFENLGDTSTAHFADGVSDEVREVNWPCFPGFRGHRAHQLNPIPEHPETAQSDRGGAWRQASADWNSSMGAAAG